MHGALAHPCFSPLAEGRPSAISVTLSSPPRLHGAPRQGLSSVSGSKNWEQAGRQHLRRPEEFSGWSLNRRKALYGEGRVASPGTRSSRLSPCPLVSSAPMEIDRLLSRLQQFFFTANSCLYVSLSHRQRRMSYSKRIMCDNVHDNDTLRSQK